MSAVQLGGTGRKSIQRILALLVLFDVIVVSFYCLYTPSLFEELEGHRSRVRCSAISKDGAFIATGTSAGVIRVWDSDGKLLREITGHSGGIRCMSFSASRDWLATGCGKGEIRVWSTTRGVEIMKLQYGTEAVQDLAFSDDGQSVYSVGQDKSILVWDILQGRLVTTIPLSSIGTTCVLQSEEKKLFIGCEDGVIRQCDLAKKQVDDLLQGHSRGITGLAVTEDFERMATSSGDHTVRLWDVSGGNQLSVLRANAFPEDVVFCDEGRYVLAGFQGGYLHVIDATKGARVKKLATPLMRIDNLSNNGADLCVASGNKARAVRFLFRQLVAQ